MPRPFNRRQTLENDRFLAALRRTGNVRLAARGLGVHRSTYTKRRAKDPAFAAEWDAALALAYARLKQSSPSLLGEGDRTKRGGGAPRRGSASEAEPQVIRLANGRLQLRAANGRRIDRRARQAFLAALGATANVRLAARAAGFAHSSFYRLRDHDPAFAREMRLALQTGYDRIEMALLESFAPASARDDAWRTNDPPPIPPMTAAQAIQLLYLHQKEARLWGNRPDIRARRGETGARWSLRANRKWRAEKAWDREGYEVARALCDGGKVPPELEHLVPLLPDLSQVTGWSQARPDARRPDDGDPALFGGWRLNNWEER